MTDDHDEVPDEVIRAFALAAVRSDGCTCNPTIELTERVVLDEIPGVGRITGMSPIVYHDDRCPIIIRQVAPTN